MKANLTPDSKLLKQGIILAIIAIMIIIVLELLFTI
tara:strand:+ start:1616 stop:1723 length:108 start_codon:yes stop_codon:yes gene_type:complete